MSLILDHVFVFAQPDDTARLAAAGLTPGSGRRHAGQGTANARFFFWNAYLELIWIEDEADARSPVTSPTRLWERSRWRDTGASPVGVALRRESADESLPFETWSYQPAYLPWGMSIEMASNSERIAEPLIFVVPGGVPPCEYPNDYAEPLDHPVGIKTISRISIDLCDVAARSAVLQSIESEGLIKFLDGDAPLLRLEFDGGSSDLNIDLRKHLPLVIS